MATRNKTLLSEFIGTFILVFAGTGAMVTNDFSHGQIGVVGIGVTFGLAVMTMVYALGPISGAHMNPAVTIALWSAKRFSGRQVFPYIISQLFGALAASSILHLLFPHHPTLGATIPAGSAFQSFVIELIITFLLVFVILAVSRRSVTRRIGPAIVIGSVVGFAAIFAGPISGGSMNPARSLGPAIVSGQIQHLWIYLIAPTAGAIAAVPLSNSIFGLDVFKVRSFLKKRASKLPL